MSEIVNTATIKVVADATEATAGLRPLDDAVAKTGKNLENLGATAKETAKAIEGAGRSSGMDAASESVAKTGKNFDNLNTTAGKAAKTIEEASRHPGFERVGEGAGTAASQVDRATNRMAESIKRAAQATEALSAGAKGSAEHFAALANLRGLNAETLKPFIAQLDEAQRKTDLVAQAQRRLDESTKFLNDLKSRTEGIGKSASELAALRAAQLGVSDTAGPMIQKMREAEQAGDSWTEKLKVAASELKNMAVAAATAAAVAATAGAALINNAINDLAQLDDMAQKTGSSIESLSKIQKVVTVFGPDMASVNSAIDKLAKGMATVDDESNKTHKALTALGVSWKDASGNLRDPSKVLVDAAKALQNYSDGAGKTAAITDLLTKSGVELIPFLNDLAENYDKVTGVSDDATTSAASFQDQLGWLKLQFKDTFTAVAIDALPALKDLAGSFLDVYKNQKDIQGLDSKKWADDLGLGIAQAADAAVVLGRGLSIAWNSLKAVMADMKLANVLVLNANPMVAGYKALNGGSALQDIKDAIAERNKTVIDANARLTELLDLPIGEFEKAYLARVAARGKRGDRASGRLGKAGVKIQLRQRSCREGRGGSAEKRGSGIRRRDRCNPGQDRAESA
jgi:hypothetical protein